KYYGSEMKYIEILPPEIDSVLNGVVTSIQNGSLIILNITPVGGGDSVKVNVSNSCTVTLNNASAFVSTIKVGDNLTVNIKDGEAKSIIIKPRNTSVANAKFKMMIFEPTLSMEVTTYEGIDATYIIADKVTVRRNGTKAELSDLVEGDTVDISLTNDMVTDITAKSTKATIEGVIDGLNISASGSSVTIKVTKDNSSKTVDVVNSTQVYLDDAPATVYDLRVGSYVSVTIDNDTVQTINTKARKQLNNIQGVVLSVNDTYGFLFITTTDDVTGEQIKMQVFTQKNGGTKIMDNKNNNKDRALGNIQPGESVIVTGTQSIDGTFGAATIIILQD
ncbi:MAG: hypothetical protein FWD71_23605, partial [Oscillospiraceae bacterium]|nr:hypothetical protein [Oscillospiraceae bacterium]